MGKNKTVKQGIESIEGIRKRFDEDEGLWHIDVFTQEIWISVATHCDEYEADDCIGDLLRWRKNE